MKKLLFIMNPFAGTKKANRFLADIISIFNRAGYDVLTYMTAAPGDCVTAVVEKAAGMDLIVCAGGDGTFNETVTGLLRTGLDIPVGYIPAGSTNDFAASLKLPTNVVEAARLIAEGEPVAYDVGTFADRNFTYVASFGAFTRVSYATPQSVKNALGHTAYLLSGLQELSQIRKFHLRFELDDGNVIDDDFIFGAISNSTSIGGLLTLDPKQVDMRDGKFELFLVRAPRDVLELSECALALTEQKYNCKVITFCSASKITVTAPEDMNWTLDGEMEPGHSEVVINNLHHAIRLMTRRAEA